VLRAEMGLSEGAVEEGTRMTGGGEGGGGGGGGGVRGG